MLKHKSSVEEMVDTETKVWPVIRSAVAQVVGMLGRRLASLRLRLQSCCGAGLRGGAGVEFSSFTPVPAEAPNGPPQGNHNVTD